MDSPCSAREKLAGRPSSRFESRTSERRPGRASSPSASALRKLAETERMRFVEAESSVLRPGDHDCSVHLDVRKATGKVTMTHEQLSLVFLSSACCVSLVCA